MPNYSVDRDGFLITTIQPDPIIIKQTKNDIKSDLEIAQGRLIGCQQEVDRLTALLKTATDLNVIDTFLPASTQTSTI